MRAQHLVTVWNPTYATNALEAHVRVLLDLARTTDVDENDVYVWWGKVKSSQRQQAMPHLAEVVALDPTDCGHDDEVHLYLTDYRSLYVASVNAISTADPRVDDAAHVPAYYTREALQCDCWFLLHDIRLLVRDDLEGVASELKQLRNVRYNDRPLSLYGGMVDLPLLVARPDPRRFFGLAERKQLTDGQLWAVFDSEQGGVGAIEATLRLDHFGAESWGALDGTARRFVTMAESALRLLRNDQASELSAVVISYGKALEVQLTRLLHMAMSDAPEPTRYVTIHGVSHRLPDMLPLTLQPLITALAGEQDRSRHLCAVLTDGPWLVAECAATLDAFVEEARNPAAHGNPVSREVVIRWRNRLLGVGCEGLLPRLARIRRK